MKEKPRKILPDVKRVLDSTSARIAEEARHQFCMGWVYDEIDLLDESPIEQMLSIGLVYAFQSREHFGLCGSSVISKRPAAGIAHQKAEGFVIRPQQPIGKYRADFFVTYRHYNGVAVGAVIECDGHEFHERTKEQARRDKERDRYFQSLGLMVLRYSGSEIFADSVKCAIDALTIIFNRADEAIRDGG